MPPEFERNLCVSNPPLRREPYAVDRAHDVQDTCNIRRCRALFGIGMMLAGWRFVRGSFPPMARDFTDVRLTLARFLAIALEFQLGADILSTAVAPSWEAIGKLAAIAVIRTALNYFLSRDMQEERNGAASVGT